MITYNESRHFESEGKQQHYIEGACLSSDTKPTGVMNGSKLMEMDTSTMYMYDAEAEEWRAWT